MSTVLKFHNRKIRSKFIENNRQIADVILNQHMMDYN